MGDAAIHAFSPHATDKPAEPVEPDTSPLAALRARAKTETADHSVVLPVPDDPDWAVRFSKKIDYPDIVRTNKAATQGGTTDLVRAAALILIDFSRALLFKGEPYEVDGAPVTLGSDLFVETMGVVDAVAAVQKFYGLDGHVIATAAGLTRAAGYGDEVLPDPTRR